MQRAELEWQLGQAVECINYISNGDVYQALMSLFTTYKQCLDTMSALVLLLTDQCPSSFN